MPMVISRIGADEPNFEDIGHADRVLGLIRKHYHHIAIVLSKLPVTTGRCCRLTTTTAVLSGSIGFAGFESAVGLRRESWQRLRDAGPETAAAIQGLFALADAGCSDQVQPRPEYAALDATAAGELSARRGIDF
jgi:hypothetical protein